MVDDVEVHGVAAHFAESADGGLPGAHGADRLAVAFLTAQFYHRSKTFDRAREEVERGLFRDQLAALIIVLIGQQRRDRYLVEIRIAEELFAVGKGELGALDLEMNELRARGIEAVQREALEQGQLLQHHRALAPGPRLADGIAAIIIGQRRLYGRQP